MNRFSEHPMEQDYREWSRVQSFLSVRGQVPIHTTRLDAYRALAKAVEVNLPDVPQAVKDAFCELDL